MHFLYVKVRKLEKFRSPGNGSVTLFRALEELVSPAISV
jgi:hypothetical protein